MDASAAWINDYLDPPASAEEQAELLTMAGFPLEGREDVDLESGGSDVRQDFEMTSNRGDCVCHVGLAREVAAISGRSLRIPQPANKATGQPASEVIKVRNLEPERCPLYTARVIRGVKVGPSPGWLADRLRAIGQIPRNNIVDATNFVLFELGQPTHVFDLAKLMGPEIVIRMAKPDEPFLPIGEGAAEVRLRTSDLVIADAQDAVAIAGVKGGAPTAVTEATTDIVIEAATFNPVTVRDTSRALRIASDSSYRFERGVHPGHVDPAAERLVELILETAGGTLCEGVASDGAPIPEPRRVAMRPARCRKIMGVEISDDRMVDALSRLGFAAEAEGEVIRCTVPVHRLDIEREIDLIEEVGRMFGHDNIPIAETIDIRVAPPQPTEAARQAVTQALVGEGFVESITHSLASEHDAEPFLPSDAGFLRVDDDRARAAPILRPSLLPSLLRVRALNDDRGVGPLRLFESASTFVAHGNAHGESRKVALLADVEDESLGVRPLRGVVERLVALLCGFEVSPDVEPSDDYNWLSPGAGATVTLNGRRIGWIGLVGPEIRRRFDLDVELAAAELELEPLYEAYPPETEVEPLPAFPPIERDISAILEESTRWADVHHLIDELGLDMLEAVRFVTTFRGKQIGAGRKSLTLRLRFRAPGRTLRHDEVDPQVEKAVATLTSKLGAEVRT